MPYTLQFTKYNGAWMPTHSLCQLTVINSHLANSPHNSYFTTSHFKDGAGQSLASPRRAESFWPVLYSSNRHIFFLVVVMYKLQ